MNIDLLPFSAFALESSGAASGNVGEAHTMTLRLDLAPVHPALAPAMGGSVSIGGTDCGPPPVLRAAVVPAVGPGLTITF